MSTIFTDPIRWFSKAVSSRPRFWFMVAMMGGLQFALVYTALIGGWRGGAVLAACLTWFQFLFLFAMRALYLRVVANQTCPVASQETPTK